MSLKFFIQQIFVANLPFFMHFFLVYILLYQLLLDCLISLWSFGGQNILPQPQI